MCVLSGQFGYFVRDARYVNKDFDDIFCSKCGGETDLDLECRLCEHDMWHQVYPEHFLEKDILSIKIKAKQK